MGGKSGGEGGKVYDYYGSIIGLVCAGPVDELVAIVVDSKTVWPTATAWKTATSYTVSTLVSYKSVVYECLSAHTSSGSNTPPNATYWQRYTLKRSLAPANPANITVPGYGSAFLYWGTSSQTLDTTVEKVANLNGHPPYRRQCFIVLKDFLFGREKTSAPNVQVIVRRKPNQSVVTGTPANLTDGQANLAATAADLFTDPVFGAGAGVDVDGGIDSASWNTLATSLNGDTAKVDCSPILERGQTLRQFAAQLLAYYDGFLRFNASGRIEAGRFPHNSAPPTFTAANTIDFHDLIDEASFSSDGFANTANQTQVKFTDREKSFKPASVAFVSGYNLAVTNEPRSATIDRPWITRRQQATDHAAEYGKINAEPKITGTLVVRAEKASTIRQGDLFLLTHDALAVSIVCRCVEKELSAPASQRATIRFESDRASAPVPYAPTPITSDGAAFPDNETLSLQRFFQPPPLMLSGTNDATVVPLIARTSPLTIGANVWLRSADLTGFYQLGSVSQFAITGTLQQDYNPTLTYATASRSRTSNVVTITTNAAHGLTAGMVVTVSGLADSTFNGTFTIASAPTSTTITYSNTGSDVTTTADTGGTVDPGLDDVTETLRVTLNGSTDSSDLAKMMGTQTEDAVADNAYCVLIQDEVSTATTNRARASNVVTLTFAAAHKFFVGQQITVAGLADSTFNGLFTVTSVPSSTTLTYANTGSTVTTTADTGGTVTPYKSFEVLTLRAMRVVGAEAFYRVKARRGRFNTALRKSSTGAQVWIFNRYDLQAMTSNQFSGFLAGLSTATFRLQSVNAENVASLTDTTLCPDISYTFNDPYAPAFSFISVKAAGTEITDFTTNYSTSTDFTVSALITDASADLTEGRLYARLGTTEVTLWSQGFSPSSQQTFVTTFKLPSNGEWQVWISGKDSSGRVKRMQMTAGGGTSPVTLKVGVGTGGTVCASPVASPADGGYPLNSITVSLSCSTSGATIKYSVVAFGAAPGTYSTNSSAFSLTISSSGKTVYAYAQKAGLTDSPVVQLDYWKEAGTSYPPGTQPP